MIEPGIAPVYLLSAVAELRFVTSRVFAIRQERSTRRPRSARRLAFPLIAGNLNEPGGNDGSQ
jgi:hypothetical protein